MGRPSSCSVSARMTQSLRHSSARWRAEKRNCISSLAYRVEKGET